MKTILLYMISSCLPFFVHAQTCLPGGITFTSQAEINAFPANYPGCTNILGDVLIDETVNGDITNVDSLSQLVAVSGNLSISNNPGLTNLYGLLSLTSVNGLLGFHACDALLSLNGLQALTAVGSLGISSMDGLIDMNGLNNLSNIGNFLEIVGNEGLVDLDGLQAVTNIPGSVLIWDNDALTSLNGLNGLVTVGSTFFLHGNPTLSSLSGLNSLTTVNGYLRIYSCPVTSLNGLNSLEYIANELDLSNTSISDFSGLDSLQYIQSLYLGFNPLLNSLEDGLFQIDSLNGGLSIHDCPSLINLDGLDSLKQIGGSLLLSKNTSLSNLSGLDQLIHIGEDLDLNHNTLLASLNGLNSLEYIGGRLSIDHYFGGNAVLTNLMGLESLQTIGGYLYIYQTHGLIDLEGLSSLESIGGDAIFAVNGGLQSLTGLISLSNVGEDLNIIDNFNLLDASIPALESIGSNLEIRDNTNLENVGGFNSLTTIGDNLIIKQNYDLDSISGFTSLISIGGYFDISDNLVNLIAGFTALDTIGGQFKIDGNPINSITAFSNLRVINGNLHFNGFPSLQNLNSFSSLTAINGYLRITASPSLASLAGLDSINPSTISNLLISSCSNLSYCELENICTYLDDGGPATIFGNALGCASIVEVQFSCDPTLPECTNLTSPANGATEVPLDQNFNWNLSPPITMGYILNAGTTIGGDDILDSIVLSNTNFYDPMVNLPSETKVYFNISPYNEVGVNTGCPSDSFYTVTQATWIGGTGTWDMPANWDVGMVPTDSTRVIIGNGSVTIPANYLAVAGSIVLSGIGQLLLEDTASLDINMAGLNIVLEMEDSSFIRNNGIIRIGDNGPIESTGVYITEDAELKNDTSGIIQINNLTSSSSNAIHLLGTGCELKNFGLIQIGNTAPVLGNGLLIVTGSKFTNTPSGEVFIDNIEGAGKDGIQIVGGAQLNNDGSIFLGSMLPITRYGISLASNGFLLNHTTGSISIDRVQTGIFVNYFTNIENDGEIHLGGISAISHHGLYLAGYTVMKNDSTGIIYIDKVQHGITIENLAALNNYGLVKIGSDFPVSGNGIQLSLDGDIYNMESGTVEVNRTNQAVLMTGSGSWFYNYGTVRVGNVATSNLGIYLSSFAFFNNENTGYLEINSISTGHAIRILSNAAVSNFGEVNIGSISTISMHGISMATGGDFNNYGTAVLEVNRCLADGINLVNTGANLVNYGIIHIGNLATGPNTGLAVTTSAIFTNHADAVITINRTTGYAAIVLNGSAIINNSGTVQLGNSMAIGGGIIMWASGKFNNLAGSTLEINRATWTGVLVDQSGTLFTNNGIFRIGNIASIQSGIALGNGGDFINNTTGSIEVDRINDVGIQTNNSGSVFTNNGSIQAGTNGVIGNAGISVNSSSSFTNSATGSIQINNANVNWWTIAIVVSAATFTNTGFFVMGDLIQNSGGITVAEAGTFTNAAAGSIQVHNTFYNGIQLYHVNTTFTNHGSVVMGGMADLGYNGIAVSENATFTNSVSGSMVINNVKVNWWSRGILLESAGKLNNSGSIQLGNTNLNNSGVFIQGAGIFTNNAGAALHINNAFYNGIELTQSGSSFVNHGSLMIGAIGNVKEMGIKLLNSATFTNSSTGIIHVDNVNTNWWSRAISVTASTFNNSGTILEGNLGLNSLGLLVESMGSLINNVSGDIEINNATYHGIQVNHSGSSCTNHGSISIGAAVATGYFGIVLYENGSMTNSSTGNIEINHGTTNSFSGGIFVSAGAFTNSGLIKTGNISNVNYGLRIGESATLIGTFSNFGTIEIDRVGSTAYAAIYVHANSTFSNEVSGIVKLGHLANVLYGIYGGGTASNYGLIQTKSVQYGTVDYAQTMTNYAGSVLESLAPGTLIIETAGTLHNNAGAILRSQPGGFIRIRGVVNNLGLLEAQ